MRVWTAMMAAALIAGASIVTATGSDSGRGRHKQFFVVPTPGVVKVDGKLDEWDLSGQIEMFVVEATRATQAAKIAAMYDDQALYLSGEITDPTPLLNRHDPQVNANRAWDADSVQFRIVLNPESEFPVLESAFKYRGKNPPQDTRDDIVHLLLWHFTDAGSANLQMHLGMGYRLPRPEWAPHGLVPADKFAGVYRKWDDGRGYTFEYRIPWETLGAKRPLRAGDRVAATVNVLWSRPDGLKTGGGSAWAYDILGRPGFPFQDASCWGRVIFAETGNVPRALVLEGVPPERTLPLEFRYSLPNDGHTTVQLFSADGRAQRIIVPQQERPGGMNIERWDGLDDTGALLPAGEYRWRGVQSPVPVRAEYRFSAHNSGQPAHPTDDNKGGWGADHGYPRDVIAVGDDMVLSWSGTEYGWGVIRVGSEQGRKKWGSKNFAVHMASDGKRLFLVGGPGWHTIPGVHILDAADSRPSRLDNGQATFPPPPGGADGANEVTGVAYHKGRLYAAFAARNLVAVYDTKSGACTATWIVPTPGRLAVRPDGALLVISEGKVLRVAATSDAQVLIAEHLDQPQSIAVAADGAIYVANQGALQNVSVFAADGAYLRGIGKTGGRPAVGAYDASGMYMPGGVALDPRGRLWVAETTDYPKRFSAWDVKTGQLVHEFFGGSSYFAYGYIDPDRPDEIYAHNVLWEIDWEKYQVRPKTTIWRSTRPNQAPAPHVDAHTSGGGFRIVTANNGLQFGWGGANSSRAVMLYMREGDIFRPIAGIIDPWKDTYPALEKRMAELDAEWTRQGIRNDRRPRGLFWQDTNDDSLVDPDELTIAEGLGQILSVNKDMSLLMSSGYLLRPREIAVNGRPVYDPAGREETPLVGKLGGYAIPSPDGGAYTLDHGRDKGPLTKWSAAGEQEWYYPDLINWRRSLNLPTVGPGRLWGMTRPMGVAGEFVLFQTYFGANQLFRADGMYVGCLLQDGRNQNRTGADTGQPEGQGGAFIRAEIDGTTRYFAIGGGQDARVWEVLGLDQITDLTVGVYQHTPEQFAAAEKAQAAYEAAKAGRRTIHLARGREALETVPPAAGKELEGGRGVETRAAYDAENLYVRFEVKSPHGLENGQANPQIIFLGGNCLDIQLATDPKADPKRDKPAPGDLRLLITRKQDQPFAVLYRPRLAGFTGERIVLTSPTGEERFDAIDEVAVGLDYETTPTGFTATVIVPLATLGFKPVAGQSVRMDLGYVFGNSRGTSTTVRAYVTNNSFSANIVDDIPHESRLEPAQWGEAVVR